MTGSKTLPTEIQLALDVMPCQALRLSFEAADQPHACAFFGGLGTYHAYDYADAGPPPTPGIEHPVVYHGKRRLVPEILSGCRKAPIMAVGINPNLPGWWESKRNSVHPFFDEFHQYAHYFRYRALAKLQLPRSTYDELRAGRDDDPADPTPLTAKGSTIEVEPSDQKMYVSYQQLLDGLAATMGWAGHSLKVGEDLSYGNMVACASAKWLTRPDPSNPRLPVMSSEQVKGVVRECFYDRRHFLRQLFQSLPAVLLVFSGTTRDAFVTAMRGHFVEGDPKVGEPIEDLLQRPIRLRYGALQDGTELVARVVFVPHASGDPQHFEQVTARVIEILAEEARAGQLALNEATGHLRRPRGDCSFCDNPLYRIGPCDYASELVPLRRSRAEELSAVADRAAVAEPPVVVELAEQERMLQEFLASREPASSSRAVDEGFLADKAAISAYVLAGDVATMTKAGKVIRDGRVYVRDGEIVAVRKASDAAPEGFEGMEPVDTQGTIYPGLLDLHNHIPYNVFALWEVPDRFENRGKWRNNRQYKSLVSKPFGVLGKGRTGMAMVRYVEAKALLGGTTAHQGVKSVQAGLTKYFRGIVRNFESGEDPRLPAAGARTGDLVPNKPEDVAKFRRALERNAGYFYHLAEGVDRDSRKFFTDLVDNDFLKPSLLGIHSLALDPDDFVLMAEAECKVIWSPLSNMLLYGKTIDPKLFEQSEVSFAIGCDWAPTGSKNLLEELKVARLVIDEQGASIGNKALCVAVTRVAAEVVGWGDALGVVSAGRLADLLVVQGTGGDVYDRLVEATEREVALVVIGGVPRHGDAGLMTQFQLEGGKLEPIEVGGVKKCLHLWQEDDLLEGLSFRDAKKKLEASMSNLRGLEDGLLWEAFDEAADFRLIPDFDDGLEEGFLDAVELPESVPLDVATVVDDETYFERLAKVEHLPGFVKDGLRGFYGGGS